MMVLWLTFILSEGDHRLYHVEPWVEAHQQTLSRSSAEGSCHAIAPMIGWRRCLDYVSVAENWVRVRMRAQSDADARLRPPKRAWPC